MEYCNGGSLRNFINQKKKNPKDEKEKVKLTEAETLIIFK